MSGSDFIFCFQDKNNRFWQVDDTGSITVNNKPYFLQFAPDGWDNVEISNIRNRKYWGIDRAVSVPLSYVQDAAHILKHIFYNLGIEESVYLVIASQTLDYVPGVSYGFWYKQIYRGEVDLSTYSHAGSKITCTTLEDGIPKYLKANENTVYEFPMNVSDAITVKGDGINLHEKLTYSEVAALDVSLVLYGTRFYSPTNFISNDGNSVGILTTSQFLSATPNTLVAIQATTNCILTNVGTTPVSVNISGVFEFKCTGMTSAPAYACRIQFVTSTMSTPDYNTLYHIVNTAAMVVGNTYSQAYSITVPLVANEKLFVIGTFFGGPGSDVVIQFTENSKSYISFITRQKTTNISAFRPQYLFEQLINKMTAGKIVAAKSNYFLKYQNIVFTCGNAIRGVSFPDGINPTVMKISFAEFFQFWDSFDSVGLIELDKVINFGNKVDLVDKTNVIQLQEPSNLKVTVAKDYLFNEVAIGYPDIKNEIGILNGAQEFNVGFNFSLGMTKSPAKINKISKIKASCYEIELIRVTTFAKDTTDNKADNENYVLQINGNGGFQSYYSSTETYRIVMVGSDSVVVITGDFGSTLIIGDKITLNGSVTYLIKNIIVGSGVWNVYLRDNIPSSGTVNYSIGIYRNQPYNLDRSLNSTATGLTEPSTVFNIGLSPKRMLLNNGAFLRSSMYKADSLTLKYVSSDRNKSLVSGGIVEKDNVTISNLGDKFFYPVLFDFDVPAPYNLLDLLNTNPLQVYGFYFYGDYYTGIVVKSSIAPSSLKSQNYQLLSTSENDLSKLIQYYGG